MDTRIVHKKHASQRQILAIEKNYLLEQREQLLQQKYNDSITFLIDIIFNRYLMKGIQNYLIHPLVLKSFVELTDVATISEKYSTYRGYQDRWEETLLQNECLPLTSNLRLADPFLTCLDYKIKTTSVFIANTNKGPIANLIGVTSWFTKDYLKYAQLFDTSWLYYTGKAETFEQIIATHLPTVETGYALLKTTREEARKYLSDKNLRALINLHNPFDERFPADDYYQSVIKAFYFCAFIEASLTALTYQLIKYSLKHRFIDPYITAQLTAYL
ncbi:MAG: hypothetical protein JO149_08380, partial [Gammaproteobacteria bacterium]|nr:hypothetical protein [Gammaproteobacteria bacterium]